MPIYEYRCAACGHKLEALQKFSEAPLSDCPVCGKNSLTKLLSAAGFQLKGSGWYATDFRNSGAKPAAKPDATTASRAKDKGHTKPDAKPGPKPGTNPDTKPGTKPHTKPGAAPKNKAETKTEC